MTNAAHGLKGISRTIGADELADACQVLEEAARRAERHGIEGLAAQVDVAWDRVRIELQPLDADGIPA